MKSIKKVVESKSREKVIKPIKKADVSVEKKSKSPNRPFAKATSPSPVTKSYERLRVQKGNDPSQKSEWDRELEREEEARQRVKDIEEAVQKEAERRRQEDEDKRRKDREALQLKDAERIRNEQELNGKIEK